MLQERCDNHKEWRLKVVKFVIQIKKLFDETELLGQKL